MSRRWLLFLTVLVLLFFFSSRARSLVGTAASVVAYPFVSVGSYVGTTVKGWSADLKTNKQLRAQCAFLSKERSTVRAKSVALVAVVRVHNLTHELTTFKKRFTSDGVQLARIIAKTLSPTEQTMMIDKGSRDGVERDAVVFHVFHLLGRVMDVYPWYSRVLLVTDRRSRVPVVVGLHAEGIGEGSNDEESMVVKFINRDVPVSVGELVLTSGQGLVFPEGLGCGEVRSVQRVGEYHEIEVGVRSEVRGLTHCLVAKRGSGAIR